MPSPIPVSLFGAFLATLRRDLLLALRRRSDFFNPLAFFLIVCSLFPLGISPDPKQLALLAPGILWVVALLACLLASDTMFRSDYDDGSLEQMLLSPVSLYLQVLAKTLAHWMLTGLPLTLLSPLLAVLLQMPALGMLPLMMSLCVGTAVLSFIGAIGAALTVGLRKGGLLLSLIILPLYIPVLIFGVSTVKTALEGMAYLPQLAILGALLALAVTLAPLAIAASVRISVDN
ncbi:heme exporter protein CcmB [Oceanicoccus sp. KOV_DT_Chl]|uniref:heme exporter protein CcmB n=1 Tax=Oceanicoccus sp. KOV_DT_Chl TaxID=1904639 RepID=UPI000C7B9A24|nr:heme exporter protein CcmB [Oceanicoccus sp. KOV_DT_Chl]